MDEVPFGDLPIVERLTALRSAWCLDEKLHRYSYELVGDTRGSHVLNSMARSEWSIDGEHQDLEKAAATFDSADRRARAKSLGR